MLIKNAFPVYASSESIPADKRIFKEILKSLLEEQLMDVNELLEYELEVPWELKEYIEWLLREGVKDNVLTHRNEPISTLIRWFADKKSGKAVYACSQLKKRFPMQSYAVQKQILKVFLSRTVSSADWAAARLLDDWVPSLAQDLQTSWERWGASRRHWALSLAVLRYLPKEYAMSHQEELAEAVGYAEVCSVLGNEPGFIIDESRFDTTFWFIVMANLGRDVGLQTLKEKLREYFSELDYDNPVLAFAKNPSLGLMQEIGPIILPALRKMHATELLLQLGMMQTAAVKEATSVDEEIRFSEFKRIMRDMLLNDTFNQSE